MFQQAIRNMLGTNENIKSLSKVIESLNKKTGDITKNYNANCTTEKCDKLNMKLSRYTQQQNRGKKNQ